MSEEVQYNPLDKMNLGASVAQALLLRRPQALGSIPVVKGAGIYAIYYVGDFPLYGPISTRNQRGRFGAPIYIGKAVPEGARKGTWIRTKNSTTVLARRLKEHAESIRSTDLRVADFFCRYLMVDDIWIPLGETLLIAKLCPLWNSVIDGFGNHDPGKGRHPGMRPRWDVLHPGRKWAEKCQSRIETRDQIVAEVANYLAQTIIPGNPRFLDIEEESADYAVQMSDFDDNLNSHHGGI